MKKFVLFLGLSTCLFAGGHKGPTPAAPEFNPTPEEKKDKDKVLESFTTGDQTDIFGIPVDNDQLSDYLLLKKLDKMEEKYQEKEEKKD